MKFQSVPDSLVNCAGSNGAHPAQAMTLPMREIMRHRLLIAVLAVTVAFAGSAFAQQAIGQQGSDAPAPPPPAAAAPVPSVPAPAVAGQAETVIVTAPTHQRVFDMQQCTDDGKFCQMATCVSVPRPDGALYMCQSHGNFFP